jgi:hypothetical protein
LRPPFGFWADEDRRLRDRTCNRNHFACRRRYEPGVTTRASCNRVKRACRNEGGLGGLDVIELAQNIPEPCASLSPPRYGRDCWYNSGNGIRLRANHIVGCGHVGQYFRRDGHPTPTFDPGLGHDDGYNLRPKRDGEYVDLQPWSRHVGTPIVTPPSGAPSEVEAMFVDVGGEVEMLARYEPRGRNEMARDRDGESFPLERDPFERPVSEDFAEQEVGVELGAALGPPSALTEPDGSGDGPFAPTVQLIPNPPPSRLLEQSRDVRAKLLVIQRAGKSKLMRVGVESLGEFVGMTCNELAQAGRPRLGSPHEKRELPHWVTPRAARHRCAEPWSNPGAP